MMRKRQLVEQLRRSYKKPVSMDFASPRQSKQNLLTIAQCNEYIEDSKHDTEREQRATEEEFNGFTQPLSRVQSEIQNDISAHLMSSCRSSIMLEDNPIQVNQINILNNQMFNVDIPHNSQNFKMKTFDVNDAESINCKSNEFDKKQTISNQTQSIIFKEKFALESSDQIQIPTNSYGIGQGLTSGGIEPGSGPSGSFAGTRPLIDQDFRQKISLCPDACPLDNTQNEHDLKNQNRQDHQQCQNQKINIDFIKCMNQRQYVQSISDKMDQSSRPQKRFGSFDSSKETYKNSTNQMDQISLQQFEESQPIFIGIPKPKVVNNSQFMQNHVKNFSKNHKLRIDANHQKENSQSLQGGHIMKHQIYQSREINNSFTQQQKRKSKNDKNTSSCGSLAPLQDSKQRNFTIHNRSQSQGAIPKKLVNKVVSGNNNIYNDVHIIPQKLNQRNNSQFYTFFSALENDIHTSNINDASAQNQLQHSRGSSIYQKMFTKSVKTNSRKQSQSKLNDDLSPVLRSNPTGNHQRDKSSKDLLNERIAMSILNSPNSYGSTSNLRMQLNRNHMQATGNRNFKLDNALGQPANSNYLPQVRSAQNFGFAPNYSQNSQNFNRKIQENMNSFQSLINHKKNEEKFVNSGKDANRVQNPPYDPVTWAMDRVEERNKKVAVDRESMIEVLMTNNCPHDHGVPPLNIRKQNRSELPPNLPPAACGAGFAIKPQRAVAGLGGAGPGAGLQNGESREPQPSLLPSSFSQMQKNSTTILGNEGVSQNVEYLGNKPNSNENIDMKEDPDFSLGCTLERNLPNQRQVVSLNATPQEFNLNSLVVASAQQSGLLEGRQENETPQMAATCPIDHKDIDIKDFSNQFGTSNFNGSRNNNVNDFAKNHSQQPLEKSQQFQPLDDFDQKFGDTQDQLKFLDFDFDQENQRKDKSITVDNEPIRDNMVDNLNKFLNLSVSKITKYSGHTQGSENNTSKHIGFSNSNTGNKVTQNMISEHGQNKNHEIRGINTSNPAMQRCQESRISPKRRADSRNDGPQNQEYHTDLSNNTQILMGVMGLSNCSQSRLSHESKPVISHVATTNNQGGQQFTSTFSQSNVNQQFEQFQGISGIHRGIYCPVTTQLLNVSQHAASCDIRSSITHQDPISDNVYPLASNSIPVMNKLGDSPLISESQFSQKGKFADQLEFGKFEQLFDLKKFYFQSQKTRHRNSKMNKENIVTFE